MKAKRIIILVVVASLLVVYILSILPNLRHGAEWSRTVAALQSVSVERFSTAARSFALDKKVTDTAVPLRRLVSSGYLRPEEVRNLDGNDVAISLTANETTPSEALIRVPASDGSDIVLLADGSIQKMARR